MSPKKKPASRPEHFPPCAVPGCPEPGEFRAPVSREQLNQYQHLCLEHVRKFNQAWNYFDGWNRDEIETFMHSSVHGHRPTWAVHHLAGGNHALTPDALEAALARMMGEAPPPRRKAETKAERKTREALATLGLEPGADTKTVKKHYKMLVKKYHPDVNSGKEAEETFRRITDAYVHLSKREQ